MDRVIATKGNLIATKKSLELANSGFDLLDKKRNVLIKEMMTLLNDVKSVRTQINESYIEAYKALQEANISIGLISELVSYTPIDNGIETITFRSVMGVEIPKVIYNNQGIVCNYDLEMSNSKVDLAYQSFYKAKKLTVLLAEVENSVYRLAHAISKTQKRANALQNVSIPNLEENVKFITNSLEEKEREEFSRQKVIKQRS